MSEKKPCRVVIMEHPAGVSSGCIECRKILRTGTWLVGIIVGAQEEYKYLVGANPPVMCCCQEKQVIESFDISNFTYEADRSQRSDPWNTS